jgi:hypothetical protein
MVAIVRQGGPLTKRRWVPATHVILLLVDLFNQLSDHHANSLAYSGRDGTYLNDISILEGLRGWIHRRISICTSIVTAVHR